jgi:hypothetical protein
MNRLCTVIVAALIATGPTLLRAAPPTVTPSPGYDARLQEQHKAATATTPDQATTPPGTTAPRHHTKRKH